MGQDNGGGVTEKYHFLRIPNFADELNEGASEQCLDDMLKILPIDSIALSCYLQGHPGTFRDLDCLVQALFRGDPAEKCEVFAGSATTRKRSTRQTMMDCD